jgi:hypothetical protein
MSLRVELDKGLERRFRELAMRRYGYSKGSIKKATELAIKKWSEEAVKEKQAKKIKDSIELMEGLLVELKGKKTSVELQHEAMKLWSKSR